MRAFSIVGLTGSGKTSVIEKVIAALKERGFSVGSVKEIHYEAFKIDTEGKNTWRHRQAGATTVTARAHYETDIMYTGHLDIYEVLSHYKEEFVALEGVRDANVPQISCCKEDEEPEITPLTIAISGRFANNHTGFYKGLPIINGITETERLVELILEKSPALMPDVGPECCSVCGTDCKSFLAKCLKGEESPENCALKGKKVSLIIGGKEIAMVPFVQNILKNAVLGVVKELKGYKKGGDIRVEFIDDEGI
ncbi:MAG TPA: molybdopterin-guanine dinucleotide biosynthesis protein B [Clostridia bacterium]|jgi:molybdopterin-guanine dinucleotide biosynthesis protein B|nr:molybdopterin-guanine dinucleotide biosynthesis protein B [Clostridia bacterium]HOK81790.1 molybdopterin-guanine dinucleotide biosynthesis protein B [Clostridia bacterium]HOL60821.1 molybdopterin-guanine dinucleotide biosynthesis protein B [Clostridia bacterium]HPO53517.1 molybdopterin-guanine dinucleotide biosynthesis protein B [Clostridia bacterium]